jgi:hypothetical protein
MTATKIRGLLLPSRESWMLHLLLVAAVLPTATTVSSNACPADSTNRHGISPRIIVQGGIQPNTNPSGMLAIGPKQDDPAQPKPGAASSTSLIAIGPKQDDPAQPKPGAASSTSLIAIGPKQDDPAQPRPNGSVASMNADCGLTPAPLPH